MQIARLLNHVVTLFQQTLRFNLPSFTKAQSRFFFIFILAYSAILVLLRWRVSHDPGSPFFTVQGYAPKYSLTRLQQAHTFLQKFDQFDQENVEKTEETNKIETAPPRLCMGMPTARRSQQQYVDITIASLFDHLTSQERAQIQFNLLIAHTNPHEHPFYDESASTVNVSRLADNVIFYPDIAGSSESMTDAIRQLEEKKKFNEKSYYDYDLLLHQCAASLAPYILILEDDILAQEGWFARTMESLQKLDTEPEDSRWAGDWLYLRLFFTEKYHGWHEEHWPSYLRWSCVTVTLVAVVLLFLRLRLSSSSASSSLPYPRLFPQNPGPKNHHMLSFPFIFIFTFVCVPALIILYFAAGPQTVQPFHPGIVVMNNYGCCSQAFVFRRQMSLKLLDWFDERIATDIKATDPNNDHGWKHLRGPVDSAMEIFANEQNLQRYAIVPSAFQHIGAQTYKEDTESNAQEFYNISGARGIWNFGFEQLDPSS
jgi:GR25 family glycosyltransferase involved in LPS biosynthesis